MIGELGYRRMLLFERSLAESVSEVTAGLPVRVDVLHESEVDDYFAFRPDTPRTCVIGRLTGDTSVTWRDTKAAS